MLWPEKMLKLRIYVLESESYDLVSKLHELGVLHIKEAEVEGMELKGVMSAFDELSEIHSKLSPLAKFASQEGKVLPLRETIEEGKRFIETAADLLSIESEMKKLKEERSKLEDEIEFLKTLVESGIDYEKMPSSIRGFITEAEGDYLHTQQVGKFFFALTKAEEPPASFLYEFPATSPKKKLKELEKLEKNLEKELSKLESRMEKLSKNSEELSTLLFSLQVHLERAKIFSNCAGSKRVVAIEGWVPEKKKEAVEALKDDFGSSLYVEWEGEDENGPTLIENPKTIKPFELAYDFSSLPRAGELNASFFYALTFPIIYGMIIGDVFYSLVAVAIASLLRKKFPNSKKIKSIAAIWTIAAVGGIFWGIAFDEWMGAPHMFYVEKAKEFGFDLGISEPLYKGIHRLDELPLVLGLSGLLAVLHLTLGNLLGAYTAFKHKHLKHGYARLGWGIAIASFGALVASYIGVTNLLLPSSLALLAGVALIYVGEGPVGLLELPSLASNTASYFRIAAVGVAGVVLAEIINEMVFPTPSAGAAGSIALFITFIILQVANAFIAAFESTIQGGRLEILEFRSKFVEGGGFPYSPFKLKKR